MKTSQINLRIDAQTKAAAEALFAKMGLTMADATRMFYHQAIHEQGMPFRSRIPNKETLAAMEEMANGGGQRFATFEEIKRALESE